MSPAAKMILRIGLIVLLTFLACLIFPRRTTEAEQVPGSPSGRAAAKPRSRPAAKGAVAFPSAEIQTLRNVGKAYYEQGKYVEAVGEFQKVIASNQALAADHLNLALALMQANRLDEALGSLTTAKQMDPKLVAADYNLGILFKRELRYPDAQAALKRVIKADPRDPAAWFNLGTVYFAQKKLEDALQAHQHVVEMGFGRGQNFYVASLFHSFTTLVRLKRPEEAQKYLKIHERMRDLIPGISLQNPALEGGKYGAIAVPPSPPTLVARRTAAEKVTFLDITGKLGIPSGTADIPSVARGGIKAGEYSLDWARRTLAPQFGASLALGDYDNDGRPDVYVVDPARSNRLYHNNADGTFTDVTAKAGVAGSGASLAATFADYTNSGHSSLFVAGVGGVRLYRNKGDGTFVDETEKAGLQGQPGEVASRAVLFDADNDGFLDLLVTSYTNLAAPPDKPSFVFPDDFPGAVSRFYRNNGDGTFSDVTASSGLSLSGRTRQAVFADFDGDGYADVLLVPDDGPPALFLGRGECKFVNRTAEAGTDLARSAALDVQVSDFNHDGNFDLALWSRTGYQVLLNRGGGRFRAARGLPAITPPPAPFALRGMVADLNGDSFDDLVGVDASGKWHWIANRAGRFQEAALSLPSPKGAPIAALAATWLSTPGKLNLVAALHHGQLAAFEKEGPAARWLEVKMNGYKSNLLGVGSMVELKAGNFYDKVMVTGDPVRVYTGALPKLDVVRVTWPNAVVQNWVNVATDKSLEVRESERLATSCPFVYVWDGKRFVYLTDVLGTAPLGELLPDGSRIKPYPEEFVRLPESLRQQDGMYVFQFTDELREVDYFDQVRLLAVDHPATEEIYANEIYTSTPSPPALYAVRQKYFPVSAVDDHGNDVLPLLRAVDGRYPTDFRQNRIMGLADVHTLTLDLGAASSNALTLWLTGWVFWTDSNGARALMSNSRLQMVPPYLQVRDEQGQWVTVIADMGMPSATNRTMRVDLTGKFLSPDRHVRIVTNFCVYWDQIFFTMEAAATPPPVELPLVSADLHYRGFSTPIVTPGHTQPEYFDYIKVLAEAPWNPMFGNYTRYGDTATLVSQADDQMVAMATGDELTVQFDARALPPLKPGWKRTLFLYTHGWAKDGEPNTAFSKTVEPLPFRQMSNYPYGAEEHYPDSPEHQQYLRDYQTRPRYLLIPPLAPPLQ
jgi:Tfp pilus assembly protein PilF